MSSPHLTIAQFCEFHGCSTVIIEDFVEHGIFEAHYDDDVLLIPYQEVPRLEKALRIHLDLGVNVFGIDIILNLLSRLEEREFDNTEEEFI